MLNFVLPTAVGPIKTTTFSFSVNPFQLPLLAFLVITP